jgi:hypothetical protein
LGNTDIVCALNHHRHLRTRIDLAAVDRREQDGAGWLVSHKREGEWLRYA